MTVIDMQEAPRSVRILAQARTEALARFDPLQRYVDTWEPAPMPAVHEAFVLDRRMYPAWLHEAAKS